MKDISIYTPVHNKNEREQISILSNQIFDMLGENYEPDMIAKEGKEVEVFFRHSFMVTKLGVFDTTTEPYMPVYNRYILKLLLLNLAGD